MDENELDYIFRLEQKLSEYSGIPVEVLHERIMARNLDFQGTSQLILRQIFCYPQAVTDDIPRQKYPPQTGAARTVRRRTAGAKKAAAKAPAAKRAAKRKRVALQ